MRKLILFLLILFLITSCTQKTKTDIPKSEDIPLQERQPPVMPVSEEQPVRKDVEVIETNLKVPWEIAFLPTGEMIITERDGELVIFGKSQVRIPIKDVFQEEESGLMGMALHPDFSYNNWIYLYYTSKPNSKFLNQVVRYKLFNNKLSEKKVIIEYIPGKEHHDGGRIAFGPDGYLYITTGDATNEESAQDLNLLSGKILRLKDDGAIPEDNPFNSAVYSYGHRNPQGLAWDDAGRLWATEHGPSGAPPGYDEVNLIEKGKNYGWPDILGTQTRNGMVTSVINSGITDTWAPAGMAFWNRRFFFGGLRGESLYEAILQDDGSLVLKKHFTNKYGRIRAVVLGRDDYLYISTSNLDGRGNDREGDDKILKINPEQFL